MCRRFPLYTVPIRVHFLAKVTASLSQSSVMASKSTGRVKWFCPSRGYGFLEDLRGGEDAFVHFRSLKRRTEGWRGLYQGEYVAYIPQVIDGKTSALDVTGINGGLLMCEAYDGAPQQLEAS